MTWQVKSDCFIWHLGASLVQWAEPQTRILKSIIPREVLSPSEPWSIVLRRCEFTQRRARNVRGTMGPFSRPAVGSRWTPLGGCERGRACGLIAWIIWRWPCNKRERNSGARLTLYLVKTPDGRNASTSLSLALFSPQTLGRTPRRNLRAHLRRKITKIVRLAPASSVGYWLMDSSYHGIYDVTGDGDIARRRSRRGSSTGRRGAPVAPATTTLSRWWSATVSLGRTHAHARTHSHTHIHTCTHAHMNRRCCRWWGVKGGERKSFVPFALPTDTGWMMSLVRWDRDLG